MHALYTGIDLHATQITYHIIERALDGTIAHRKGTVAAGEFDKRLFPLLTKNSYVCIEATSFSRTFYKMIKPYVAQVCVINPGSVENSTGKKTDRIDAHNLAGMIKRHIEDNDPNDKFPEVFMPEDDIASLRSLFSTYDLISREITSLKNRIRSFFIAKFINISGSRFFTHLEKHMQDERITMIDRMQIQSLLQVIDSLETQKLVLKKEIVSLGKQHHEAEIKLLISIKGISPFIACAILADIATARRFKNAKHFVSYLRCAPRIHASNETVHIGAMNKRGRKLALRLILQALNHIISSSPALTEFYQRKTNGKSKSKVRAAIARKTFTMMYYMLRNNEINRNCSKELYAKRLKMYGFTEAKNAA